MMKKSASIVGLCLILVIAGCAGSDVVIPGADRAVSDLISEDPGVVAERAAAVAQKSKKAKCDGRSASVRNKIEGTTWTAVEEVQGGGSEHVEKCVAGLCKKGIKVDLDAPTVEGSYAFFLKFDPTSMEPWSKLHERDGSLKGHSITLTQLEDAFKKGFPSQEDEMFAMMWYGYGSLEEIEKQHHNSPYGKLKNRMNGEYAPALCMYGDCHQVPRHSSYAGNMFAIGYEYSELFDKYPELWPADLKVDPLDCYQPPDPKVNKVVEDSSASPPQSDSKNQVGPTGFYEVQISIDEDSTPLPSETVAPPETYLPREEYPSCAARKRAVREKFGGKTWIHPVLNRDVCIFGFCEPKVDATVTQYVINGGLSNPIDSAPPDGNVVTIDGKKYVLWGGIKGSYDRHETYEDNMFALGHLYPNVYDRNPDLWPDDLTKDPLGCYTPPGNRMNR